MNISYICIWQTLKKTGKNIIMAYHMEQGSDVMDYYETMCNTIASGLTTGRVQTWKQDPIFSGR